jgi:hypothetical protein
LNFAVNLLPDLSKLQLGAKNLIFLLLKSCLSFFKSTLKLLFLYLKPPSLFVKLMDRATTISKLIKKIPNFISKILVLTLDNIKLFNSFIMGCLQTEQLTVEVATLFLACINLSCNIFSFGLPLTNDL